MLFFSNIFPLFTVSLVRFGLKSRLTLSRTENALRLLLIIRPATSTFPSSNVMSCAEYKVVFNEHFRLKIQYL